MNLALVHRLAVGALAAVMLAVSVPVSAADYDDRGEPLPWRGGTATNDGYPVPVPPPPVDYRQSYKDDDALPPPPLPRAEPRRRVVAECLSKYGIREALNRQGWHEFANVEIRGEVAYMVARNDNGRPFDLEVDSCSGDVFEAHPRVVYTERPVYYERYYTPRPAIGLRFGGGHGRHHRRW
ncbi:MAG: hypothetical protein ABL901_13550 [Hyphomicrobiaceae bacterium]